jgi:hypothetical protein
VSEGPAGDRGEERRPAGARRRLAGLLALLRPPLAALAALAIRLGEVLLVLVLIFEEWGWRPLGEFIARLRRLRLWALTEDWIAGLPPYGALVVLAVPSLLLLPLKLVALWLVASGQALLAGLLLVLSKVVGTALVARLFLLTRPQLMQIAWFARLYAIVMPWKEALFAAMRASWAWRYGRLLKARIKVAASAQWAAWRPRLTAAAQRLAAFAWPLLEQFRRQGRVALERLRQRLLR